MDAVVDVGDAARLQEALRCAVAERTPVGVRSSTGPARYGRGRAPDGGVLLDLSSMRRVVGVSRKDRVALVEAGVTYAELAPVLADDGLRLPHPLLPVPGKSVVAAVMDREPTLVPRWHWDMTDPLLCAELYFGTGDRFRTGGAAGPGATLEAQWDAGMQQKNPLGPAQTDLIKVVQGSQATMGVAAWVSLRCEVAPEIVVHFTASSETPAPLVDYVAAATRRRLGAEVALFDAAALAAVAPALAAACDGAAWTCVYSVASLPLFPDESVAYQLDELDELAAATGVDAVPADPAAVEALFGTAGPEPGPERRIHFLTHLGRGPDLAGIAAGEWDGAAVYVQPLNQGRSAHVEVWAPGAPSPDPEHDAALAERLAAAGAFFHRPHGAAVAAAYRRCPDTVAALGKVKRVLDPVGILSPGALWADPAVSVVGGERT